MTHRSFSPYERRVFMDNRYYRSTPTPPCSSEASAVRSLTPRYYPSTLRGDHEQTGYFGDLYDNERDGRSRSPYRQGFYGYDLESRMSGEEIVRRVNGEAARVNGAIPRLSRHAQLHPMMTPDKRYPPAFSMPRPLQDFFDMSHRELDRILEEYDIGSRQKHYYRGALAKSFDGDDLFSRSDRQRQRDLVALFEFLGAYRPAQQLYSRWSPSHSHKDQL